MSNLKIKPEQFESAVMNLLSEYGDEFYDKVQGVAKNVSRQTASAIKGSAPSGGSYAKGWSHKAIKNGYSQYTEVVYNRSDAQLAHLLEYPHSTGRYGGGHYPLHVNYTGTLARIEEEHIQQFMSEVMKL